MAGSDGVEEHGDDDGRPSARRRVRRELAALAEVAGLAGLAFTRPVLDSFGRSPETFITRGASGADVVAFALIVALVPTLVVGLLGLVAGLAGDRSRARFHLAAVGLLAGLAAWRLGVDATTWATPALVGLGAGAAVLAAVLRRRYRLTATYLRYLGAASVLFVGHFLLLSPANQFLAGDDPTSFDVTPGESASGDGAGDLPPVVVVVLDALPTASLLDGTGRIDAELYPHLAAFAEDATWYRNHTTTAAATFQAVPALLTGRLPELSAPMPDVAFHPGNLFSLLAGTHDVEAVEQITRLCPPDVCPREGGGALRKLLGDAVEWWRGGLLAEHDAGARILPGALEPDRLDQFLAWVEDQDFTPGDRPGPWFYHLVMPHDPWVVLDDGTRYAALDEEPYGLAWHDRWDAGTEVARQRHVLQLQAVDRALGVLFDELRAAGTYDDALVVVVGDHGEAFTPGARLRGLGEAQFDQVAWTPLLIKAPGQTEGAVDDANVLNVDLLPTIADLLGIGVPWETYGVPARQVPSVRPPDLKPVLSDAQHDLEPAPDSPYIMLDAAEGFARTLAADPVPAEGEGAVWRRTRFGHLVGRPVAELAVGEPLDAELAVRELDHLATGDPPLLELVAPTDLEEGAVVAVAVDGTVAAVAPVEPAAPGDGERVVHALLHPDAAGGDGRVAAHLVEGAPGSPTLRPLRVVDG